MEGTDERQNLRNAERPLAQNQKIGLEIDGLTFAESQIYKNPYSRYLEDTRTEDLELGERQANQPDAVRTRDGSTGTSATPLDNGRCTTSIDCGEVTGRHI